MLALSPFTMARGLSFDPPLPTLETGTYLLTRFTAAGYAFEQLVTVEVVSDLVLITNQRGSVVVATMAHETFVLEFIQHGDPYIFRGIGSKNFVGGAHGTQHYNGSFSLVKVEE